MPRGSQKGERRGGRKKGTPNKATAEIRELAQAYAPEYLAELARLAKEAQSESVRVSAIGMLLDRGYGKASQQMQLTGKDDEPLSLEALIMKSFGEEK